MLRKRVVKTLGILVFHSTGIQYKEIIPTINKAGCHPSERGNPQRITTEDP
jgi:hypothetical protein